MRWDRCGEIQRQKVRAYLVLGLLSAALAVVLHLLYHRQRRSPTTVLRRLRWNPAPRAWSA